LIKKENPSFSEITEEKFPTMSVKSISFIIQLPKESP